MNRFFYGFIAFLFLFLSIYPFSNVFADNDLIITGTPAPVPGDITDDQLSDIIVSGITADLVSQGYEIDFSASDGDWDNFKNSVLDIIFDQASSGTGFIGEIYNSALYHNLIDEDFTIWYPDTSDGTVLPGLSKRSIYRNLSDGLVNNILEHRSDGGSTPTPNPDINYLTFIDAINGTGFYWKNYPNYNTYNSNLDGLKFYPANTNSWFSRSVIPTSHNGDLYVFTTPIKDVYIFSQDDTYYYEITFDDIRYNFSFSTTNIKSGGIIQSSGFSPSGAAYTTPFSYSGTLAGCFASLKNSCRNINIYVDGEPWSIVSEPTLPTINIFPGYVLQGTNYPMQYYFPEPPQFDYQRMIDIIKHALLQYGVVQWEDIADVFVDVNGQTAVAILEMHRNDYDVLYDEQYPGIPIPNRFNTHLLDTSHQYLSPVVQTVEETTDVLPGEIKGALAIGMMLTIFACLIHRLLE